MVAKRGIALVTALFAVVLLFGFATAMLAQVRGDVALTRELDQRSRARALARSAVQAGLYELNRDPAWEALHTNEPATRMLGGHELRFWVEPTEHPGVIRLRGESSVGNVSADRTMLVSKAGGPGGLLVQSSNELFQSNADGSWTLLPTAPARLQRPVGGPQGEVYGIGQRLVYRLDPETQLWSALPPLPVPPAPGPEEVAGNSDPAGGDRPNEPDPEDPEEANRFGDAPRDGDKPKPKGLAVDGAGKLYALLGQVVVSYDGTAWTTLPPPGAGDVRFLSADDAGHVWVVRGKRFPTRYDPALGRWQQVAETPPQAWAKPNGNPELRPVNDRQVKSIAVDAEGHLFVSGPKNGDMLTIYRFVPGESDGDSLPGTWRILPTVPNIKMKKEGGGLVATEPGGFARKADNLALDGSGTLYFRLSRDEYDTLYRADVGRQQPSYGTLDGIPKVKRKNGEQVEMPGEFSKDVKFLGGGRAALQGSPRYVPRYTE